MHKEKHDRSSKNKKTTLLLCLQPYFLNEKSRIIDAMCYLKNVNCFPNAYISYDILLFNHTGYSCIS